MLLKADAVTFGYTKDKTILKNIDFQIESGEIVGITAPSGFGKSTLGKLLAGYLQPNTGTVTLDGKPLKKGGYNPVQLIFQHPEKNVDPKWKMKKVLREAWNPPQEMIEEMGIRESWMNRWPSELSGGELQRFCVLRALSPETKFLIADEMTTMLDVITQAQIWQVVKKYARLHNMGIIVISHEKALVERLCTRVVYLDNN
ncbi:MAG: ATP-binding cassette domain-containing protein [Lachnospiraceae bacterium]|nr:ATP-binding cassette domain-containing protein [Lachnospiraceae bacterium]